MKHGAGILFTDGKKILLLKRAEGDEENTWGLPGGGAKKGETPLETAKRETKEECGIDNNVGTKWAELTQKDSEFCWTTFMYDVVVSDVAVTLSDEHTDWLWFDLTELNTKPLHPKLKPQIPAYLALIRKKYGKKFTEWARIRSISY